MGCGCNKRVPAGKVLGNTASRSAVYQVVVAGNIISEHTNPGEARKAAAAEGGRVRVTSRADVVQ